MADKERITQPSSGSNELGKETGNSSRNRDLCRNRYPASYCRIEWQKA